MNNGSIPYDGFFFVKSGIKGRVIRIFASEIIYIEASLNYVVIHHERGEVITYLTLSEIEERLDGQCFLRVHKSFIINLKKIDALESGSLIMSNKTFVHVGAKYRDGLNDWLMAITVISKRH